MSHYLAQHPNICMSEPKETNFFCTDLPLIQNHPLLGFKGVSDYHARCFAHLEDEHKAICDATVWNLYSRDAVKNILEYNPDAKFVVMIRNPATMVFSLHSMYVGLGYEMDRNFLSAFQRSKEIVHPSAAHKLDKSLINYQEVSLLGEQLQRLRAHVPAERIKVIFQDDFSDNTRSVYNELLTFLELPAYEGVQIDRINAQRRVTNPFLLTVLRSEFTRVAAIKTKQVLKIKSLSIGIVKPPMSLRVKQHLADFYRQEINLLSALTFKDLSHWADI